ncbi:hypothetical protein DFA_07903 [Cavenderia fasciculata]|uniref:Ankyrin repeat-containing protein n=1 Tax=Cavenderia fasciculata TaxID=261658 RepID=F4Q408_CACFS|nr:uncharacterized protein DFA_07903 [Cavenderia fasciculata]EGG16922.1 hypothetical protein DFA_07903 [Cavenderia fasciculata]|eukprot:XP_004355396.1 hypothetical protein DFA_07903 [Cavenderia fasciculata]
MDIVNIKAVSQRYVSRLFQTEASASPSAAAEGTLGLDSDMANILKRTVPLENKKDKKWHLQTIHPSRLTISSIDKFMDPDNEFKVKVSVDAMITSIMMTQQDEDDQHRFFGSNNTSQHELLTHVLSTYGSQIQSFERSVLASKDRLDIVKEILEVSPSHLKMSLYTLKYYIDSKKVSNALIRLLFSMDRIDVTTKGYYLFDLIASVGSVDLLDYVYQKTITSSSTTSTTLLYSHLTLANACLTGSLELVEYIVSAGLYIDPKCSTNNFKKSIATNLCGGGSDDKQDERLNILLYLETKSILKIMESQDIFNVAICQASKYNQLPIVTHLCKKADRSIGPCIYIPTKIVSFAATYIQQVNNPLIHKVSRSNLKTLTYILQSNFKLTGNPKHPSYAHTNEYNHAANKLLSSHNYDTLDILIAKEHKTISICLFSLIASLRDNNTRVTDYYKYLRTTRWNNQRNYVDYFERRYGFMVYNPNY